MRASWRKILVVVLILGFLLAVYLASKPGNVHPAAAKGRVFAAPLALVEEVEIPQHDAFELSTNGDSVVVYTEKGIVFMDRLRHLSEPFYRDSFRLPYYYHRDAAGEWIMDEDKGLYFRDAQGRVVTRRARLLGRAFVYNHQLFVSNLHIRSWNPHQDSLREVCSLLTLFADSLDVMGNLFVTDVLQGKFAQGSGQPIYIMSSAARFIRFDKDEPVVFTTIDSSAFVRYKEVRGDLGGHDAFRYEPLSNDINSSAYQEGDSLYIVSYTPNGDKQNPVSLDVYQVSTGKYLCSHNYRTSDDRYPIAMTKRGDQFYFLNNNNTVEVLRYGH